MHRLHQIGQPDDGIDRHPADAVKIGRAQVGLLGHGFDVQAEPRMGERYILLQLLTAAVEPAD
jgi:hypothetical protein